VAISSATNLRDRKGLTVGYEVMANLSGHPQLQTSVANVGRQGGGHGRRSAQNGAAGA
jgi:hypothetical protein